MMCHTMHTYGERCIIIPNVFGDTILGALKHIDIVYSKTHQLVNNFISKHTSPYAQCLHNHFGQIVGTKSFQNTNKGNQNQWILTQFSMTKQWTDNQDWLSKVETSSYYVVVIATLIATITW